MTDLTLAPTGTCFEDAARLLLQFQRERPELLGDLRLVHGIVTRPTTTAHPVAHAWLEDLPGDEVLLTALQDGERAHFAAARAAYYAEGGITDVTRYTWGEAVWHARRHGHDGPWVARYRRLCGRQEPA